MANQFYTFGRQEIGSGHINLASGGDTIGVLLCTAAYVANLATDQHVTDITAGIVGAVTLAGQSITGGVFRASNASFGLVVAGNIVTQAVIFKNTGVNSTSTLIFLINQGSNLPMTTDGGNAGINWDTGVNGIFVI